MQQIYLEHSIAEHEQTAKILQRFPRAHITRIEHFGEVFNPRAQNFRLQKKSPALILARKQGKRILTAPAGYGLGGKHNYYFSHMQNCAYDCRYCFLQGMYRSAHYVLFVNYEDFLADIQQQTQLNPHESSWFFSGYDCDSLAYEPVSQFARSFLPHFAEGPAWLELRTKSTQIRSLLQQPAQNNVVVAFSLSPEPVIQALEHGTPALQKRLSAIQRLQQHGWRVGLRFDPIIYDADYRSMYQTFFQQVFQQLDGHSIHSASLGAFRLPRNFYRNMLHLYPEEPLLAGPLSEHQGMMAYSGDLEAQLLDYCEQQLLQYIHTEQYHPCQY